MKTILTIVVCFASVSIWAQDSTDKKGPAFSLGAYVELYYSYDLNKPADNKRPFFLYNFNRHNEFNLNLGLVRAGYSSGKARANLAIGLGTYMNANYAAEEGSLQHVFEANAGARLLRNGSLWLDIGILPSHIGFESAIGKDNWTLSRSLAAENSPYFETGAKLSYSSPNEKWLMAALALNGWQRIKRVDGHQLLSWGTQTSFKPSANFLLNYSSFLGTDQPDSNRSWRYYHNLYAVLQVSKLLGITAGFDLGQEQKAVHSKSYYNWYSPVLILRLTPGERWAFSLRGEYFSDKNQVLITTASAHGFQTSGISLGVDYSPQKNMMIRLEGRQFHSRDEIFSKGGAFHHNDPAINFSTAIAF